MMLLMTFKEIVAALILTCGILLTFGGYASNASQLVTKCDFEPIGKCELVRGAGVVIVPLGVIAGYLDLGT